MRPVRPLFVPALLALILAACGDRAGRPAGSTGGAPGAEALPGPTGTPGEGVTGMPGAREDGEAGEDAPAPADLPVAVTDEGADPLPPDAPPTDAPPLPLPPEAPPPTAAAPSPAIVGDDAVALVRDYHRAINAGAYGRAYAMWADGGRASGPSPQQLADDFASIAGVSAEISAVTATEPGALQVEVPVSVTETLRDGRQRRLTGSYILRRTTPDAAWRIAASNLREAGP